LKRGILFIDGLFLTNSQLATDRAFPMSGAVEYELALGLQRGDSEAIKTLYIGYFNRLYCFVFHSVRDNHPVAEDIVQDVFISALKSSKSFKGNSKIFTWLVSIARHKIVDYYRTKQNEVYYAGIEANSFIDTKSSEYNSRSVAEIESVDLKIDVGTVLASLPLDYRQVLLLKYVEEMTIVEISRVMNRSRKSVDGVLTRARNILRKNLSENVR
jgi:RNA polymerase sigma-70 factor, ECF subfamily